MRRRKTVATRVCARLPSPSFSLRSLVEALCEDEAVPLAALAAMDAAVVRGATSTDTWHRLVAVVGHEAMLRALLSLAVTCSTGPCTALAIVDSYARVRQERQERQERLRAVAQNTLEAFEERMQRARQAGLVAFVDGELTSPHETGVGGFFQR